jgi:uncharacterized SAM-binding protein YcdF (DUF218 family)
MDGVLSPLACCGFYEAAGVGRRRRDEAMRPRERSKDVKPPGISGWECARRGLGLAGVVFFLASAYTPLPNLLYRRLATPSGIEPAGAIVVLGASVSEDGILGSESLRRAVRGIILQRQGLAPLLVFSGAAPDRGPTEAEVRAALARDLGVSQEVIVTESVARTTREEAIRIGGLLRERQVRRILLVTNTQHLARARRLFERLGLEVFPAAADDISDLDRSPWGRLKLMHMALQELVARIYYRIAGYL